MTLAMTIHIQFTTSRQTRLYSGNINNFYDMFLKNTVNIEMSSFKHIKQAMDLNRLPTQQNKLKHLFIMYFLLIWKSMGQCEV